jgi:methyl-accepting chemotaxis protein
VTLHPARTLAEEIARAIGAHGQWKARLRTAIASGQLDTAVASIRVDDQCALGRWLRGSATAMADSERDHDHREIVARLHTDFHRVAARVAELALSGNQVEAQKLMDVDGEFTHASAKLTLAMMTWKHALAGELAPGST